MPNIVETGHCPVSTLRTLINNTIKKIKQSYEPNSLLKDTQA